MPKIMHLSVAIELPADEWEEAHQKVAIHAPWVAFIDALTANKIVAYEVKVDCIETRAKRSDIGKPRARKQAADRPPRLVPPPQDAA